MTKRNFYPTCLFLITLFFAINTSQPLMAQTSEINIKGVVTESGTRLPLKQVSISVSSTGTTAVTDERGEFTISVPNLEVELVINLPGYNLRNIFLNGREFITVSLVSADYSTFDNSFYTPTGIVTVKDAVYSVASLVSGDINFSNATSFDQALQGKVPGMSVIQQSGMPGHRTFMSVRGISSLYANTEPLLFIDGMIHDYSYANSSLLEGFSLNPMDVLDIDDISNISILKDGLSYLGAAGSNGVINVNTEQKAETSTVMKFSAYGGVTMAPKNQDLLNAGEFKNYFTEMLNSQGYNSGDINTIYPWLKGNPSSKDYYKYNNSTDWQDETFSPSAVSKFHFFLKGGDDIATYNISTGYLSHKGIYENSAYTRYNLRINGKINISDKFSVTPNAKLSLADSKLANHGPSAWKNPILASALKPSVMAPYARDPETGATLDYLDDVGNVFMVSNPTAITQNAQGSNRNYHFLSSVTAAYRFNEHFNISTLVGINFNNSRENIFLPDIGMVQVDSAYNSPGDFVFEFRSTQNHTTFTYTNKTASGHSIVANAGYRYMQNSYKYNLSTDLNTPSDDFKSLGQGSQYSFLRSTVGDNRGLKWISFYGDFSYNFRNKYFVNANMSYDGNSATNELNRYNIYPSVGGAWRLSSEDFLTNASWLEDFKIRASYSVAGNMFSSVYDNSKLYYTDRRMNGTGVLTREIIPNEDLELEKKNTINAGADLSVFQQQLNVHVDFFKSNVNNLVIRQELPPTFGYTDYYDNGGKLEVTGLAISADTRLQFSDLIWTIGASVSKEITKIKSLTFINPNTTSIITTIDAAQFITSAGNPVNAYYGYKTEGLLSSAEAGKIIGPNGAMMQEGDIKFKDDGDNIINENDKTIIGDPNPELFGNIFTAFAYKNFQLSAIFNYSVGNDVFNYVRYKTESMSGYDNQSKTVLDRWTSANTSAKLPRMAYGDPSGNTAFSDRWIEDGSYLRLSQLTLNYNVPPIQGFIKGVAIYLTATNLFTITNYSGYDPDFIYMNSPFYMGVDYGKMPQTQSFIIGLKLDL
ncbi:MAG: SusC/RagA family TonB-linked outer membrane [Prolixibacteraceae bacterium]|nr:MAG: SusC/RagA family TonB-linked outer membrane [Prolixibacteraceae bacterium]